MSKPSPRQAKPPSPLPTDPGVVVRLCPNCDAHLVERKCKLLCPRCGYYMSCADYH